MKELEVVTKVDFDKQDIVTVAVAKIEALIRKKVRGFKESRDTFANMIAVSKEKIGDIGEANPPKSMKSKLVKLDKGLKASGVLKTIGVQIVFEHHHNKNYYTLQFYKHEKPSRTLNIAYTETAYTKAQKSLDEKIEKMQKQKGIAITEGVTWKSKLSDMSAVERQMRAKVVEAELNKTAEGKALIHVLTKDYEDTIKMLEM